MGSLLSSILEPPPETITGAPHLPLDIQLEIISHLIPGEYQDQKTLLSTALCCSDLRNASQRILFSNMHCMRWRYEEKSRIFSVHIEFLRAITDSPDRLALFVHSYSQCGLALPPAFRNCWDVERATKNLQLKLWYRTLKALRLMTNLKHLCFKPSRDHPSVPSLLTSCKFKLESFTWMGEGNQERLFEEFLPNQPGLLHLDVDFASHHSRKFLHDSLCPSLVSVASTFSNFAKIAAGRPIIAFHMAIDCDQENIRPLRVDQRSPAERQQCHVALKRLKYLHLKSLSGFHRFTSGISLDNVIVLELTPWKLDDSLSREMGIIGAQFPRLRILRFLDRYTSEALAPIRYKTAKKAFTRCPELESVMFALANHNHLAWILSKKGGDLKEEKIFVPSKEARRVAESLQHVDHEQR